jgi:hypothetical protein
MSLYEVKSFPIPHSNNDGGPFCRFGLVLLDDQALCYRLGLVFQNNQRFWYPNEFYQTEDEVVDSVMYYQSLSWACGKNNKYKDGRFSHWERLGTAGTPPSNLVQTIAARSVNTAKISKQVDQTPRGGQQTIY